jgi:hypothetical protein
VMLVKKEEFYLINYFLYKGCSRDNTRWNKLKKELFLIM